MTVRFNAGDVVRINDEWWEKGCRPLGDQRQFVVKALVYDAIRLEGEPRGLGWLLEVFEFDGGPW